ncbi:hypothetical protein DFH07DRAFT_463512 [Mycena maculata]|uniref:DUF6534 domain-containing protein n=1 Tax=Mycena maculata TaxID=230809 RepID=A0AAD7K7T2_9AGAR|nr:hypothetical protein DFH07DRAFT_463512 [Mycena maculata]
MIISPSMRFRLQGTLVHLARMPSPSSNSKSVASFDPNATIGALQIGVLVSYFLFGLTTAQVYAYYGRFPKDPSRMKWLVAGVWLCELAHATCIGHALYVMTIIEYGQPQLLAELPRSLGISALFNGIIAFCGVFSFHLINPGPKTATSVQGFFSFRIYRLSKSLYIPCFTWMLSFLFLSATAVVFSVGLPKIPFTTYEAEWSWLFYTMWGIAAGNDSAIALTLVFWLYPRRDKSHQITVAMIDKLIAWTIETGVLTSAAAILNLACFATMKDNFIWIAWYVVTARLYSNSFLARRAKESDAALDADFVDSLNSRTTLRTINGLSTSVPYPVYPVSFRSYQRRAFPLTTTSRAVLGWKPRWWKFPFPSACLRPPPRCRKTNF